MFRPLLAPAARYRGAFGGRGSGKSHFFAELAIERCIRIVGTRIVCVREVQKTLKESVKRLIEDKIQRFSLGHKFRVLNDSIITPGGGVILFQGMQDHTAESIKSLEGFDVAYAEEAQMLTKRSLELLRPTIRGGAGKPDAEIWFSWNPRHASDPVDALLRGPTPPPDTVVVRTNWADMVSAKFFPDVLKAERAYEEEHNPSRYAHIWEGEYEPQALGALWDMATINQHRRARETLPRFTRIVVSIDPPGRSTADSSEAGIVACGLGEDTRGYVLDDVSMKGKPSEWATRALAVYDIHDADAIIAEVNYGGDMVANTVHAVRPGVRVIEVRAHKGQKKHIRAEPVAALYALGRVSHAGAFPKLEAQMCLTTADGYQGEDSPDRMDALVYGFTELFPKMIRRQKPTNVQRPTRANSLYNPHRMGARR